MAWFVRFLLVLLFVATPAWAAEPLRVITSDATPPFAFRNPNGQLEGYAVDMWRLWEKKTGVPVQLEATDWALAQRRMLAGEADVIDLIFRIPSREQLYDFSEPFATIQTAIYADKAITGLGHVADLKGFLVGVQEGDACVDSLKASGISTIRTFRNYDELASAVGSHEVKIFCLDEYPAGYYLYRLGLQKRFHKAFDLYQNEFRRAVRKGDTATLALVNRGMALVTPEEEAALRDKWMGKQLVVPAYATLLAQLALGLGGLALVLLVWLQSVRRAVRRRTAELHEEQARLRTLVENSPDVIWLKDADGRYLACNPLGLRLLGAPDIVGKTDADLFPAADAERLRQHDRDALRASGPLMSEERLAFPHTGQVHVFETLRTPVVRPGGGVMGIMGVARDVTLRRLQEQKIRDQEALLKEMSSMAHIGAWEFDLVSGRATWTSEVAKIHETAEDDDRSIAHCLSYYHGDNHDKVEQALRRAIAEREPADIEVEMTTARGNRKWVRAISLPVVENDKVVRVRGTMQDISERRHLEESMRMANLIYQTSLEAIAVTDGDNNIVDVNPAYLRQTGRTAEEVAGRTPSVFCSDMHDAAFYERMREDLALRDQWQGEIWDRTPDGALVARLVHIRVVRDPDGKVYRHILHFNDITEQKLKDEQIWKQTNFDPLTGLPNRRLFVDRLEQEIKKCHGSGCQLGLMFFDLDRFKHINDSFGRARGDRALQEMTRRLGSRIPETATLSRLGGDSFALLVSPLDKRLQLDMLAEALIDAIAAPLPIEGDHAYVTASVGIAVYPDDAGDAEELLRHAEQAMHLAKQDGRARFSYFTRSAQREAQAKLALTNDLRHALARHELQLYYQPIVEMASGRIRKAEALLRWAHPVHGMISPARFIPLAEESGLILPIGEWVFDEAIASIQRWQRKFGNLVELSVNNSPVQFEQVGDCEWVERLSRSGLPPSSLTVEITEGVLLKDSDQVRRCLRRLHEHGTKVSIDDFGTGYSALSYLKHLDVDYLKIDKSFVANLAEDASDQALTGSIIDMAHKLGIQTIAEGVETTAQRDLLAGFGCDYVQGHLYSRAVPRDIFELILEPQGA